MALRFIDGFDHYVTADISKKWTANTGMAISAGNGRRGTASLRTTSNTQYVSLALPNQPTYILGMAFRYTSLPAGLTWIIELGESGTRQVFLVLNTSGTLSVMRGNTSNVLGTSTPALPLNTYVYLEMLTTIHSTLGAVTVLVDGASWIAVTNVNTNNTGNAYANSLRIGNISTAPLGTLDIDDLYLCDGAGSAPHNTLLGDCRVDLLLPTSDGTAQQWTPSTPGTHYTLVDEATPNTTDYVASSTVGHRDTYGMQDLAAATGTIYGVQLNLAALKSDTGTRSLKPLLLSGASEAVGPATALSTSQTYTLHVQASDPATGAAWTVAGVNAAQCGAEVA